MKPAAGTSHSVGGGGGGGGAIVLRIFRADTGAPVSLPGEELGATASVSALKEAVERGTHIAAADQILLSDDGARLDNSQPLDAYGLPAVRSPALVAAGPRQRQHSVVLLARRIARAPCARVCLRAELRPVPFGAERRC
jgi:hypothetical protein